MKPRLDWINRDLIEGRLESRADLPPPVLVSCYEYYIS